MLRHFVFESWVPSIPDSLSSMIKEHMGINQRYLSKVPLRTGKGSLHILMQKDQASSHTRLTTDKGLHYLSISAREGLSSIGLDYSLLGLYVASPENVNEIVPDKRSLATLLVLLGPGRFIRADRRGFGVKITAGHQGIRLNKVQGKLPRLTTVLCVESLATNYPRLQLKHVRYVRLESFGGNSLRIGARHLEVLSVPDAWSLGYLERPAVRLSTHHSTGIFPVPSGIYCKITPMAECLMVILEFLDGKRHGDPVLLRLPDMKNQAGKIMQRNRAHKLLGCTRRRPKHENDPDNRTLASNALGYQVLFYKA